MTQKIKSWSIALVSLFSFMMPLAATVPVMAQDCSDPTTANLEACLNAGGCADTDDSSCAADPETRVNNTLKLVINIFSIVVGVVAVIMIIIGGLKYITSSGDSGNITSAKNTILYAIIGLVIVALAQFIVRFVLTKVAETG